MIALIKIQKGDALDAFGSIIVGVVSGILVVAVVEILDLKLHIDDPEVRLVPSGAWGVLEG